MGAAVAMMCSAWQTKGEALVADSAFATHRGVIDYHLRCALHLPSLPFLWLADAQLWRRAGYHFRQVEPLRDIAAISPRPVLLIHGQDDRVVDPRDAQCLYAAAREPKELWLIPNADHCGAYKVLVALLSNRVKRTGIGSQRCPIDAECGGGTWSDRYANFPGFVPT